MLRERCRGALEQGVDGRADRGEIELARVTRHQGERLIGADHDEALPHDRALERHRDHHRREGRAGPECLVQRSHRSVLGRERRADVGLEQARARVGEQLRECLGCHAASSCSLAAATGAGSSAARAGDGRLHLHGELPAVAPGEYLVGLGGPGEQPRAVLGRDAEPDHVARPQAEDVLDAQLDRSELRADVDLDLVEAVAQASSGVSFVRWPEK